MVIYATKSTGMFDDLPQLSRFEEINLDWFDQIYPPGFELLPEQYKKKIKKKVSRILGTMSKPYPLERIDLENPPFSDGSPMD